MKRRLRISEKSSMSLLRSSQSTSSILMMALSERTLNRQLRKRRTRRRDCKVLRDLWLLRRRRLIWLQVTWCQWCRLWLVHRLLIRVWARARRRYIQRPKVLLNNDFYSLTDFI
jgi:hypothetical protein